MISRRSADQPHVHHLCVQLAHHNISVARLPWYETCDESLFPVDASCYDQTVRWIDMNVSFTHVFLDIPVPQPPLPIAFDGLFVPRCFAPHFFVSLVLKMLGFPLHWELCISLFLHLLEGLFTLFILPFHYLPLTSCVVGNYNTSEDTFFSVFLEFTIYLNWIMSVLLYKILLKSKLCMAWERFKFYIEGHDSTGCCKSPISGRVIPRLISVYFRPLSASWVHPRISWIPSESGLPWTPQVQRYYINSHRVFSFNVNNSIIQNNIQM